MKTAWLAFTSVTVAFSLFTKPKRLSGFGQTLNFVFVLKPNPFM